MKNVTKPISKKLEIAGYLKQVEPQPVLFGNVAESKFSVMGNIFCSKDDFAAYFGSQKENIIPMMINAIENPSKPAVVKEAACQEVVNLSPSLDDLPILFHCEGDGGNYISSGVMIAKHPVHGQNMDFHRCMQFSKTEMAVRVVRNRHFDTFLRELGEVDVAICIGNSPNVLAAGASSVELGQDELEIANTLEPLDVVRAKTVDLFVPAEAEFVLEGIVTLKRLHDEGPFVDLTETHDFIRQEPVFELKAITHRKDAIWQALLPGAFEHKLLMGMPREPTIYKKVNEVVKCLDVNVSPGGSSWLHAVVQIEKIQADDGKKAIEAAFQGHRSCKHVFVVDEDIDIYDPLEVEWAMATRFQGDQDLIIKEKERGSSLDPSSEPENSLTTKIGFDLTKPLQPSGKAFEKVDFPKVNLSEYE
ncbi:MAG: UbiD family decarboxylase [Anaerolineaceae bacterium]|nr:UbiD family decarboxylase [Anaerolineaceae bacterium]